MQQQPRLTKEDLTNTRKSILLFVDFSPDGEATLNKTALTLADGDDDLHFYLKSVAKTIPRKDNPSEISDFHYCYKNGKLVNIDTGKPFHWVNQSHYDSLGDTIFRHIQSLMEKEYGLQEVLLPLDSEYHGPTNNIFVSPDWQTSEKLMLLIQGSGAVRPGQWARALCINDDLNIGSILPYLQRCKEEGYAVIVFNPNQNEGPVEPLHVPWTDFLVNGKVDKKRIKYAKIPGSESNAAHCLYVWDHFVSRSEAKTVAAVAHSAGGYCAQMLLEKRGEEVAKRLCGIAFTDSVHPGSQRPLAAHLLQKRCRNWVTSKDPLDTPQRKSRYDCLCVSAGHDTHEFTSGIAMGSVFEFLLKRAKIFPEEDPQDTHYDQMPESTDSD